MTVVAYGLCKVNDESWVENAIGTESGQMGNSCEVIDKIISSSSTLEGSYDMADSPINNSYGVDAF
jgi:hypothetical protein